MCPAVVPGIRGITKRRKRLKGDGSAESAQKACFERDAAAVLIDGPGAGDQLAKCLAFADAFIEAHEYAITNKRDETIDDPVIGEVRHTLCRKDAQDQDHKDVKDDKVDQVIGKAFASAGLLKIDSEVTQEVLLGAGVYIVFHKVIYKKNLLIFVISGVFLRIII